MNIHLTREGRSAAAAPILFVVAGTDWKVQLAALDATTAGNLYAELERQGFDGGAGRAARFQTHSALPHDYIVVLGVGDGAGATPWFRAAQAVVAQATAAGQPAARVVVAKDVVTAPGLEYLAEGLVLSGYQFTELKSAPAKQACLRSVTLVLDSTGAALQAAVNRGACLGRAACRARDLINRPAAIVTPAYLAREARLLGRQQRLSVKILDETAMRRIGMGAVLGVALGSAQPPRFLELVYKPPRRRGAHPRTIALVGKGVTFDSGGLSLKPASAMESQKRDMAGGAAVLGVMSVIRDLAPAIEVRAYVAAAENMPGSRAMKPGDVLTALNGTTIEVLNTDAEGRLVLADALSYAVRAKPDAIIDLATLTGAVRATFGPRYAGILGSDRDLVAALIRAGAASGENLWELPLVDEYRADIDSSVADIKNTGDGYAGTIIGALFLREFTAGLPWAHIDFSSTVVATKAFAGHPRGATGFGVRTVLRYLLSA